ncbi:MAG: Co2+/Mg2+ efflux protein ApaG [Bacteroidota bacterium]
MTTYTATTGGITVTVKPVYLEEQSNPMMKKFVFAYFIRIENRRKEKVQLLRRRWLIHHASGRNDEVEGEGVIGKQPMIPLGEFHEYNSFCVLESFEGYMEGAYQMQSPDGNLFQAEIPRFTLSAHTN